VTSEHLLTLLADIPPDAPARRLAARFGAEAGAHATVAACATGTLAVIHAVQSILDGRADVVLAGSSDASLHPLWFAAFHQIGVLAAEHTVLGPNWACRPFDASRSGFAIAEGAAVLVLESAASVRHRGVLPLACIPGYAMGADPSGLTKLRPDGAPLARIAKIACDRAGVDGSRLAAIQAHGTGTPPNDLVEIHAIRQLCGHRTLDIPIVSFKGALGHLLGAAGAVELAISVLGAAKRMLPPNATLLQPDTALGEVCLPRSPVKLASGPILKTSMGFGGHLAAVVLDLP
jgi:3-oxoacyl-[acyl-carrier-protein] synthase II